VDPELVTVGGRELGREEHEAGERDGRVTVVDALEAEEPALLVPARFRDDESP
jgi:hypothetical protein